METIRDRSGTVDAARKLASRYARSPARIENSSKRWMCRTPNRIIAARRTSPRLSSTGMPAAKGPARAIRPSRGEGVGAHQKAAVEDQADDERNGLPAGRRSAGHQEA